MADKTILEPLRITNGIANSAAIASTAVPTVEKSTEPVNDEKSGPTAKADVVPAAVTAATRAPYFCATL